MKKLFILFICLFLISCSNSDIIDRARNSRNVKEYETKEAVNEKEIKNSIDVQNEYELDNSNKNRRDEFYNYESSDIVDSSEQSYTEDIIDETTKAQIIPFEENKKLLNMSESEFNEHREIYKNAQESMKAEGYVEGRDFIGNIYIPEIQTEEVWKR